MTSSLNHLLTQAYQDRPIADVLEAAPDALYGLSTADAQRLEEAFGIHTVRDLAQNPFFHRALAAMALEGAPSYDPGPPLAWDAFFQTAPLEAYTNHPAGRFRLDFGPVYYRGRLDGTARVLVVGQDPSTNEILGHRIFVGRSGQRVQGFLSKLGLTRSYVMINAFLFSVFGQFDNELRNISLEPAIGDYRNALLDRLAAENHLQAVVAFGAGAQHAVEHWVGVGSLPVFDVWHPAAPIASSVLESWNTALEGLRPLVEPDEDGVVATTPYGSAFAGEDETPIPRFDLPFGMPTWHGEASGQSERNGNKEIVWKAP